MSRVFDINGVKIGGGNFVLIAGPCTVESEAQIREIAERVKESGAGILRGGAYKGRTSPHDYQGMGEEGIRLLLQARKTVGMPVVTEIVSADHLPQFDDVDIIQVGARNMQNFDLLKALGRTDKFIFLKRGMSNTLRELLLSAEYITGEGNDKVILCERGIRTFETSTRFTLDLSSAAALREMTDLPVVVDPSHAAGRASLVEPMALAAAATGVDGIMIEVHNDPANALCDSAQALTPDQFDSVARKIRKIREAIIG